MRHFKPTVAIAATLLVFNLGMSFVAPPMAHAQRSEAIHLYNQGIDAYTKGQTTLAIQLFQQAIQKDPSYVDAYYNLGSVYFQQSDYPKAQEAFLKAVEMNPMDYQSRYNLALSYEKANKIPDALKHYRQIPASDTNYSRSQAKITQLTEQLAKRPAVAAPKAPATAGPAGGGATQAAVIKPFAKGFVGPTGLTFGPDGLLYVANYSKNRIDKISPNGERLTWVEGKGLNGPIGLVCDTVTGNFYVANYQENNLIKIAPNGTVTTLTTNVKKPYYLTLDSRNRMLYVSEQETNTVSVIPIGP